jgi:hypothetical protein
MKEESSNMQVVEAYRLSADELDRFTRARMETMGDDLGEINLKDVSGIVSFGPVGDEREIIYAVRRDNRVMVKFGPIWAPLDSALREIIARHGHNSIQERAVWTCAGSLLDPEEKEPA